MLQAKRAFVIIHIHPHKVRVIRRKKKEKLLCMAYVLHEDRLLGEPSEDGNLYTKIRECNGLTSNIIRIGMKLLIP